MTLRLTPLTDTPFRLLSMSKAERQKNTALVEALAYRDFMGSGRLLSTANTNPDTAARAARTVAEATALLGNEKTVEVLLETWDLTEPWVLSMPAYASIPRVLNHEAQGYASTNRRIFDQLPAESPAVLNAIQIEHVLVMSAQLTALSESPQSPEFQVILDAALQGKPIRWLSDPLLPSRLEKHLLPLCDSWNVHPVIRGELQGWLSTKRISGHLSIAATSETLCHLYADNPEFQAPALFAMLEPHPEALRFAQMLNQAGLVLHSLPGIF